MDLSLKFNKAGRILAGISLSDAASLNKLCLDIRRAEDSLNHAAKDLLRLCYQTCEGLCCRNVKLDDIISLTDFIFILAAESDYREKISACLANEDPLFASNCLFLVNKNGPCLFPSDLRPEICLTSFCRDTSVVQREIRLVQASFTKLDRFIKLGTPRKVIRGMKRAFDRTNNR